MHSLPHYQHPPPEWCLCYSSWTYMSSRASACSVMSDSLWPLGLLSFRLLCPLDFPGKNAGVGCISCFRVSSQPRDWTYISGVCCIVGRSFPTESLGKPNLLGHTIITQSSYLTFGFSLGVVCSMGLDKKTYDEMWASQVKNLSANVGELRDLGSIPG